MRLNRIEPPVWLGDGAQAPGPAWYRLSGEQAAWGYVIPQMYRALADPEAGHALMRAPRRGDPREVACAYWSAMLHLTTFSLGWVRPERGIEAWVDMGGPTDDVRLALLSTVWRQDGMLDWIYAWTHGRHLRSVTDGLGALVGFHDDEPDTPTRSSWLEAQKDAADASGIPAPVGHGGWDPLHLSMHLGGPLGDPDGEVELVRTDAQRRRAVLLLDSMRGWYRALVAATADLPDLGDRSWHVEVVVRPVGSLGVHRRSRQTGIWFAGPHRYHVIGVG